MTDTELFALAVKARANAYAPYSGFKVGAALESADGRVFTGCNIENAAYPVCCCAERTALFKAVSEGVRDFKAIAVAGGSSGVTDGVFPCGTCRQALSEFCGEDFRIIVKENGSAVVYRMADILPHSFGGKAMGK